jgi:hypothetical protein
MVTVTMKLEREVAGIQITLTYEYLGRDLLVAIYGGDEYHIGGTALAYPTKSHYRDATTISVSTVTAPGHKDYVIANKAAETLSKALECTVAVTVGIHVDNATWDQVQSMVKASEDLVSELISLYQKPE